jgi:ankyrin repeat protein/serine/threonine protein kinase
MSTLVPGSIVNNSYTVSRLIGEGGMNRVYLVKDRSGRQWALKETRAPGELQMSPDEVRANFKREVSILVDLNHQNFPKVEDHFAIGDRHYLVEEFVEGVSLEEYSSCNKLSELEVIDLALMICEILEFLHKKNIIYRDLKPENIIVTRDTRLKLLDFNIARYYRQGQSSDTQALGTPGYAAPETYGSAQSDARSDIYSLAATMHRLLTGLNPQDNPFQFEPISSLRLDISGSLIALIEKGLSREPADRFPSVAKMKKELVRERKFLVPSTSSFQSFLHIVASFGISALRAITSLHPQQSMPLPPVLTMPPIPPRPPVPPRAPAHFVDPAATQQLTPVAARASSPPSGVGDDAGLRYSGFATMLQGYDDYSDLEETPEDEKEIDYGRADIRSRDGMGRTPLHDAVIRGDLNGAAMLIERGAMVNSGDRMGMTPLDWALFTNNLEMARFLVNHGADVDSKDYSGMSPLHRTVIGGNSLLTEFLLSGKADMYGTDRDGKIPLHHRLKPADEIARGEDGPSRNDVFSSTSREMFRLFISQGFDVNYRDYAGMSFLHYLAECGDRVDAELFISHGADVNCLDKQSKSPLHYAVSSKSTEFAEMLIKKGSSVNVQDQAGATPLHISVLMALQDLAQVIMDHGADLTIGDRKGRTPLHYASSGESPELTAKLISHGADVTRQDVDGKTPLHCAVSEGREENARLLLASGASVSVTDKAGMTPGDWALYYRNERMKNILGMKQSAGNSS